MKSGYSKQQYADEGAAEEDADGTHLIDLAGNERQQEDGDADPELPRVLGGRGEVVGRHEQQAGSCEETDDGRTQSCEDVLDHRMMLILHQKLGDDEHQDE